MLSRLRLENFRNHQNFELSLSNMVVLVGPNGVGKSNILEAIVVLAFCRSFREETKQNLINHQAQFARVTGDDLEVFMGKEPQFCMKTKARGVATKVTDFVGMLPAVVFSPEMLDIITGSPAQRRRFLDIMLCQVDREYLESLVNYNRIRKRRNSLLHRLRESGGDPSELDYWDNELANHGSVIQAKRRDAVVFFNDLLSTTYQQIADNQDSSLKLTYISNFSNLGESLRNHRSREIAAATTLYGPHRDDLEFYLNNQNTAHFASRGEMKSSIMALKMAELRYIENKRKDLPGIQITKPLLLLDDVFSEFDPLRRLHLSRLIHDYQTIVTTADQNFVEPETMKHAQVVSIG
ncbi:MAG: DNA replication and repair protein RecF [bacterium ADurb.Bin400]|nr:MAG: DNA replication and repair protein RecF [bacterium ADurb.Bin400]